MLTIIHRGKTNVLGGRVGGWGGLSHERDKCTRLNEREDGAVEEVSPCQNQPPTFQQSRLKDLKKKESLFLITIKVLEASRNYPVRLRGTTARVLLKAGSLHCYALITEPSRKL